MKKFYCILLFSLFSGLNVFSQITWEKLFSSESTDVLRCVLEVPGGGYIAAGYTAGWTINDTDAFVVRLKPDGDTLWTFTYNGTLSKKDLLYKIINTSDGGFISCGYTTSVTGLSDDILYIKLNSSGQLVWAKTFGGVNKERSEDIIETSDGYTIVGYTTSPPAQYYDALILHMDLNGDTLWKKIIGNSDFDDANTVKQLADGGYIIGGQSKIPGGNYCQFLIRTNISGDTLWTKKLVSAGTATIESLILDSDGYIFSGSTNLSNISDDGYLVKTDTSGNVQWYKIYGGSGQDDFHSIEKTSDGGFIIGGTTSSSGPLNPNMWLFKINSVGDSMWARTFGGDNHDHGYSAQQTSDGGYIFAGHLGNFGFNEEDGYIVKLGSDGTGTKHLTYISAYKLVSPACSGASSIVKVEIRNFGNDSVSNIPVHIEISGSITETLTAYFTGPLAPQDVAIVTFSPTINTTVGGAITFHMFIDITNDVYPQRNSSDTTLFNLVPCVGIEEVNSHLGFTLFPNPAHENVIIEFSEQYTKADIELISSTGSVVKNFTLKNTYDVKKLIDLSSLAKGIYLFKVNTNEGFDIRRIILE